jgi:hypothetical protein
MTILDPSDSWPQTHFRRRRKAAYGPTIESVRDKGLCELITNAINTKIRNSHKPETIFLGPRARLKLEEEVSLRIAMKLSSESAIKKRQYMGLDVIFTIDDGLWIA